MIRIVNLGRQYFGREVDLSNRVEVEDIERFTEEGSTVILIGSMEDLDQLPPEIDLLPEDIQMAEDDDE
jgi:hypothetical protein